MKKNGFLLQAVTNVIIVALLVGLYFACVPQGGVVSTSAPIYNRPDAENKVALTFNVYQNTEIVEEILVVLKRYDLKATFFLGGCWAEKNVSAVKMIAERNEIGNHGYLHLDHAKISERQNEEEITLCNTLIEKITGKRPTLFAPPSGSIGNNMLKVCEALNMKVIMWSKDTIDWRDKDAQLVTKRATTDIQSGDMILMHPTAHTLEALPTVIEYYLAHDLLPVTVSELLADTVY